MKDPQIEYFVKGILTKIVKYAFDTENIDVDVLRECGEYHVMIVGEIIIDLIGHDNGNCIDGEWEILPFDFIKECHFEGKVTLMDGYFEILESEKWNTRIEL